MKILLAAAFVAVVFLACEVRAQRNANPTIPQHLLPCYRNPNIYTRTNRMSSKFRMFIDLIRKIERSPSGRQKSARDVAMALIYHLRMDGIQMTPNVPQTEHITPYAPNGDEYYKHRLTLIGLLPKLSRPTNFDFINDSLSEVEMCNLHFMLSYSIDPYKRENEDCSGITFENDNRYRTEYRSPYGGRHYGHSYKSYGRSMPMRHKRDADVDDTIERLQARIRNLRRRRRRQVRRLRRSNRDREENLRKPDAEIIPPALLEALSKSEKLNNKTQKEEFTLAGQDFLGPGENHVLRGGYERPRQFRTSGGGLHKRTLGDRVLIQGQELSKCPIENGVVQHELGSITIGVVITGIAAGFYPQKISPLDLNAEVKGPLASEKLNNIWATTLAGNGADLILSLGHIQSLREGVGLSGGWNSNKKPKWYMLKEAKMNYFTDVEIRAALDGLWLGLTVEKYNRDFANIPLSQILEMYYSDNGLVFNPNVKASRRTDEVTGYAPTEEFRKQLHLTTLVLKNQRLNTVTYSDFQSAVEETVQAINSYIPQLTPRSRSLSFTAQMRKSIDHRTNLLLIFDPAWGYASLETYIGSLIYEGYGATLGQSNLTLVCGFDSSKVYPIYDYPTFEMEFSQIFEDCSRKTSAFNYDHMYEKMLNHFSEVLRLENEDRRINPYSFVSLVFLSDRQKNPNPDDAREGLERIREYIPGIEILIATNGAKEKFRSLVPEPEKDLFSLKMLREDDEDDPNFNDLLERIAKVPRRISNPFAKTPWINTTIYESDAELIDDVQLPLTALYRIDPYYIFDSKDVKLSVTTKGQQITVCHAREQVMLQLERGLNSRDTYPETGPYPEDNDDNGDTESNGDRACKKGTNVLFDFENLCEGAGSLSECKPLFLSVKAPLQSRLEFKCQNCKFLTNVEYTIKISGLSGGATTAVISMSLILLSFVASSLSSKLY